MLHERADFLWLVGTCRNQFCKKSSRSGACKARCSNLKPDPLADVHNPSFKGCVEFSPWKHLLFADEQTNPVHVGCSPYRIQTIRTTRDRPSCSQATKADSKIPKVCSTFMLTSPTLEELRWTKIRSIVLYVRSGIFASGKSSPERRQEPAPVREEPSLPFGASASGSNTYKVKSGLSEARAFASRRTDHVPPGR